MKAKRELVIEDEEIYYFDIPDKGLAYSEGSRIAFPLFRVYSIWKNYDMETVSLRGGKPFDTYEEAEEHRNKLLKERKGKAIIVQIHSSAKSTRRITNIDKISEKNFAVFGIFETVSRNRFPERQFQYVGTIKGYDGIDAMRKINSCEERLSLRCGGRRYRTYQLKDGVIPEKIWAMVSRKLLRDNAREIPSVIQETPLETIL